jgi:hypothetical protein
MVFNDTTDKLGICQEIDALCDTTSTSYPVTDKTRRVNSALETLISKIIACDGMWQFDDYNLATLPIGTQTLVAGQSSYSFNDKFLSILWVKIKDNSGYWHILTPIDQSEIDIPLENYLISDGLPVYYDKSGDTIRLYPAPSASACTLTNGIKICFQRTGSLFVATDTTKEPGIPSPWHITIAKMAALPYCKTYKKDRVSQLQYDIAEETADLLAFFSKRSKDVRNIFTPAIEDNR